MSNVKFVVYVGNKARTVVVHINYVDIDGSYKYESFTLSSSKRKGQDVGSVELTKEFHSIIELSKFLFFINKSFNKYDLRPLCHKYKEILQKRMNFYKQEKDKQKIISSIIQSGFGSL